jgi:hypothetical protein
MPTDLEVIMRIAADPSQAEGAIKDFSAQTTAFVQNVQRQFGIQAQDAKSKISEIKTYISQLAGQINFLNQAIQRSKNPEFFQRAAPEIEQLKAKIAGLTQELQKLSGAAGQSFSRMTAEEYRAFAGAELLGRSVGIYLPFQASRVIAKSQALAEILPAAFNVGLVALFAEGLYHAYENAKKIYDELQGVGPLIEKYGQQSFAEQLVSEPTVELEQKAIEHTQHLLNLIQQYQNLGANVSRYASPLKAVLDAVVDVTGKATQSEIALQRRRRELAGDLEAQGVHIDKLASEIVRLNTVEDHERKHLQQLTREQGTLRAEVLRAEAEAAAAGGDRVHALRVQLSALAQEEKNAIAEAGRDEDKANAQREIYAAKRIELEREITAAIQHQIEARAKAEQAFNAEFDRRMGRQMRAMERQTEQAKKQLQKFLDEAILPKTVGAQELPASIALAQQPMIVALDAHIEAQTRLTAAQRAALPTERELALVRQRVADFFPDLTRKEAEEAAQRIAELPAVRQLIIAMGQEEGVKARSAQGSEQAAAAAAKLRDEYNQLALAIQKAMGAEQPAPSLHQRLLHTVHSLEDAFDRMGLSAERAGNRVRSAAERMLEASDRHNQAAEQLAQLAAAHEQAKAAGENDVRQQISGLGSIAASTFLSYKQMALIKGAYYAAMAVAAWPDFVAMAEYGLASALFFKAAGEAGRASTGIGGYGAAARTSGETSESGAQAARVAAGQSSASLALVTRPAINAQPSGNVTIVVGGNREIAKYVAGVLNDHVTNNGGQLYASRTTSPPYVSPGGR